MTEFLQTLFDPGVTFLRYAFAAAALASVAFGIVGTYVVVRRITYIAGAISHCVLGGIGAMFWLLACARRGDFDTGHFTKVDMVALYWHLVDLIWIYLFLLLYLIH